MKHFYRLCLLTMPFILTVDGNSQTNFSPTNPFYSESKLPYQAPAFDKIKDSDFKPAIEEGMRVQLLETEKIANDLTPPTFETEDILTKYAEIENPLDTQIFNEEYELLGARPAWGGGAEVLVAFIESKVVLAFWVYPLQWIYPVIRAIYKLKGEVATD